MTGKHALVEQPTWRPTAKVAAVWATGAGAPTVIAIIAALSDAVDSRTVWGAAVVGLATGLAGWLKKARAAEPAK